jgi:hypothetical protein
MRSWPDHSPSGNQKRFWRNDPERAALIGEQALQEALDATAADMIEYWEQKSGVIFHSQSAA